MSAEELIRPGPPPTNQSYSVIYLLINTVIVCWQKLHLLLIRAIWIYHVRASIIKACKHLDAEVR
jgi:hypothetical protein